MKAAFIDKDGTLVEYRRYGENPSARDILDDVLMENEILNGLIHLQNKGFKFIIVSNQPFVSRGNVTEKQMDGLFLDLILKLRVRGIEIFDCFYCPHQESDYCECRKPKAGMILDAAKKHDIDLTESFMIGDTDKDVLAGKSAGIKTVLVLTGEGEKFRNIVQPTHIVKNINEIINII